MSLVFKATAIVLLGLATARLARTARASVRHAILVAMFVALAALPVATLVLPRVAIEVPVVAPSPEGQALRPGDGPITDIQGGGQTVAATARAVAFLSQMGDGQRVGPDITLISVAIAVWLLGAAAFLTPLVVGVWRVRRLRREALPAIDMQRALAPLAAVAGVRRDIDLLMHEDVTAPITCGISRAAIVVPPDASTWSTAAIQRALVHELEHVRRHDWAMQLLARVVCAVYWCNPLVWMAYRQLCLEAEHACDDAVVAREEGSAYAEQLVTLARRMSTRPAVAALGMAHRSDLAARVSAVLDSTRVRGRAGIIRAAFIAASGAGLMMAIAPLQLVAAVTASPSSGSLRSTTASAADATPQQAARGRVRRLDRALVEAADEGNLAEVRELIDEGADVNAAVDGDGSPLIVAAREGHLALVRLLVERGADPNLAVSGDGAPLLMAAREGHLEIVRLLLDRGSAIDQIVPGDENALIQASGEGQLAVVQLLVARGADVNARAWAEAASERPQGEWRTPLSMAQRGGHRAVVAYLQSVGAVD